MCDPGLIIGGLGAVVGIGGSIAASDQAKSNADATNAYNAKVEEQQKQYWLEVMSYQNDNYAKDIDHYGDLINYEKSEFDRAKGLIEQSKANIEKDYTQKVGTELLRAVQEDIATSLGKTSVAQQGADAQGKVDVSAAERGIAGNSADALSGEVSRQVGAANAGYDRNFDAAAHQMKVEMLGLKGQRDTSIAALQAPVFQPIAPPAPPPPVSPVNPAAPVASPSATQAVLGAISGGLNGASTGLSLYNAFRLGT